MTLAAQITADVTGVFLNTSDFAQTVTHYPLGVVASGTSRTAVVDLDAEDAAAPSVDTDDGAALVRFGLVELPATVTVTCSETPEARDSFLIASQIWDAVRIAARDNDMVTVLVRREEPVSTKRTRTER